MSIVIRADRPQRTRTYSHVASHAAPSPIRNDPSNLTRIGSPSIAAKTMQPTADDKRNCTI